MDVDGDNLPDKVFRDDNGTVKYRKNLAKPGGVLAFSDQAVALDLPDGFAHESSSSWTAGLEDYHGFAKQLDYVWNKSTTDRYFADVNADGISDVVAGNTVLFGRLENGKPVYGPAGDSSGTPAPVTAGRLDTGKLDAGEAKERDQLIDSFPLLDTVRRWVAPFAGQVQITGAVKLDPATADARDKSTTADGVRVAIQHDDAELWSDVIEKDDNTDHVPSRLGTVAVKKDQVLYFRVGSRFDGSLDAVSWDPVVTYVQDDASTDVNGLGAFRFDAGREFTLAGRGSTSATGGSGGAAGAGDGSVKVPLTGTLHLDGDFTKSAATSDDVRVQIVRDGVAVLDQTVASSATGSVPVSLDVTVTKGQRLAWRVLSDSPIDQQAYGWIPRGFYTAVAAGQGVDQVNDGAGNPAIVFHPAYVADLYGADDLLFGPQASVLVPGTGTTPVQVGVTPHLSLATGQPGQSQVSGQVTFTIKKIPAGQAGRQPGQSGVLAGKGVFGISGGQVASEPGTVQVSAAPGDRLFYDFTTRDAGVVKLITGHTVNDTLSVGVRPSALHFPGAEGAFPQPWRGWGVIGYNANRDKADAPINESGLVIDDNYGGQLPGSVDPQGQLDDFLKNPGITPPTAVPFTASPQDHRWQSSADSWASAAGVSSSRLGAPSIDDAGAASATDIAVPRKAKSNGPSVTGDVDAGFSLGGSASAGDSAATQDFMDMNGDGFPDVVTPNGIQYTDPTGGLGHTELNAAGLPGIPDSSAGVTARSSHNRSGNASGGAAARTIVNGKGKAAPDGKSSANTAQSGNSMPPLGASGHLGQSQSDTSFDLIDVNGDNLPDRVYDTGEHVPNDLKGKVALNLGYSFAAPEAWPGAGKINDGTGEDDGLNLGYNSDFYGLAGGLSLSWGTTFTKATLADLNGDGLADRVLQASHAGDPIQVAFNTGTGFANPVPFGGAMNGEIARDTNTTLSGGAYATFPLPVACLGTCVFNPGIDASTGKSRTEQALRDVNGDGLTDQVSSTGNGQLTVKQNTTGRTNLLKQVTLPLGTGTSRATTSFDYTRDGNTPDQPQSKWVLSKVTTNDG
ncbi:hypothetical protein, partial [Kribbella sp. NPDC004536]|uniref:hypothetical protein n=1 Tax=Kribbella sp. NPDC004536 TaxID=3364106 RepID=UPI003697D759